jgi:hypothetical protein
MDREQPFPTNVEAVKDRRAGRGKARGGARAQEKAPGESGARKKSVVLPTRLPGDDLRATSV